MTDAERIENLLNENHELRQQLNSTRGANAILVLNMRNLDNENKRLKIENRGYQIALQNKIKEIKLLTKKPSDKHTRGTKQRVRN